MSDVWRGNRPTREPADAPERTPLWEQASVYMEEVRSALIPLRGVLEQYERKVAALEQERDAERKFAINETARPSEAHGTIRDLRAAIAQMSCDMKLAQTHITNAIDEAKRLAEGEP